jgi:hypothetical protein
VSECISIIEFDGTHRSAIGSLWLQLREQDYVADVFMAGEHNAKPVNVDANAARGRHVVFEGDEDVFVQLLLLFWPQVKNAKQPFAYHQRGGAENEQPYEKNPCAAIASSPFNQNAERLQQKVKDH